MVFPFTLAQTGSSPATPLYAKAVQDHHWYTDWLPGLAVGVLVAILGSYLSYRVQKSLREDDAAERLKAQTEELERQKQALQEEREEQARIRAADLKLEHQRREADEVRLKVRGRLEREQKLLGLKRILEPEFRAAERKLTNWQEADDYSSYPRLMQWAALRREYAELVPDGSPEYTNVEFAAQYYYGFINGGPRPWRPQFSEYSPFIRANERDAAKRALVDAVIHLDPDGWMPDGPSEDG